MLRSPFSVLSTDYKGILFISTFIIVLYVIMGIFDWADILLTPLSTWIGWYAGYVMRYYIERRNDG